MEEQIDIIALEEQLQSTKLLRFFKDKDNLLKISSIVAAEVSSLTFSLIPYTIIANIIVYFVAVELYKKWKSPNDIIAIIVKELRNSDEYKKCIELYGEYIKRLADYIDKYQFNNIKEIIFYFDFLLKSGALSSKLKNKYYNFKYDRNYIVELLGARTAGGASVCRHMSALAADCFNELGYAAEMLVVENTADISNLSFGNFLHKRNWSHSVVGIKDNETKFLYDPTIARLSGKTSVNDESLSRYISKITFTQDDSFLIINPIQHSFSKKHNSLQTITSLDLEQLDEDYLMSLKERIYEIYKSNQNANIKFTLENHQLLEEIAFLESCISPHSDEKITSWIISKTKKLTK